MHLRLRINITYWLNFQSRDFATTTLVWTAAHAKRIMKHLIAFVLMAGGEEFAMVNTISTLVTLC